MIEVPQRSVTRFFVPLIDVLILLFCIFLLLPFVSAPADPSATPDAPTDPETLRAKLKQAEDELAKEKEHNAKQRRDTAENTSVYLLDIDKREAVRVDGRDIAKITYPDLKGGGKRLPVSTREEASAYILAAKGRAGNGAVKFLFVKSPDPNRRFPDAGTEQAIREWFAGESFGYDDPLAPR